MKEVVASPAGARNRGVGGPSLAFARDDLETLRQGILAGHQGKIQAVDPAFGGPLYALGADLFPPAGMIGYDQQIVEFAREQTRVASLIPTRPAETPVVTFFRGSAGATAAAVAPGGLKPDSGAQWESVTLPVRKIATKCYVQHEVMQDYVDAITVIGSELVNGIIHEENAQLLSGDGAGDNLEGILQTSGIGSISLNPGELEAEALHRGMTRVRTVGFREPDGVILHPNDLEAVMFAKAVDAGLYLAGGPLEASPRELWGTRVVVTTDIPQGTALVGNFTEGARLYVRMPVAVFLNAFGSPRADYNEALLISEERIALAVTRPANFCAIDLNPS